MTDQREKSQDFLDLHQPSNPLILFNIWDAGSAKAVAGAGAKAIATGSAPVAMARGYKDGQDMPFDDVLQNARLIVGAVDLPVTLDFEGAYGVEPDEIFTNVKLALETGVVGFNFEDQVIGGAGLYDMATQAKRVEAVRHAAEAIDIKVYINGRTDIFLKAKPDSHDEAMLVDAIARAAAYKEAGASGFFAPGLQNEELIEHLCREVDMPVNLMQVPGSPSNKRLSFLGASRISYGPVPFRQMSNWLGEEAKKAMDLA